MIYLPFGIRAYKKNFSMHPIHRAQPPCRIGAAHASIVQNSRPRRVVCGIDQPLKSGEAFRWSLSPNRHRNRRSSGLNRLSRYRRCIVHCAPYTCRRPRDGTLAHTCIHKNVESMRRKTIWMLVPRDMKFVD